MQISYPENSPIHLHYNYTLGAYPARRGNKYIYVYWSDDDPSRDPSAQMIDGRDEHFTTPYAPPLSKAATSINPAVGFTHNYEFPAGITEGKLYAFLDENGKEIHPDYNGILVTGASHVVNIPTSGQYVAVAMISMKDGKPVSLLGNAVIITSTTLEAKAAAMNLTVVDLNAVTWSGTVTKNQTGLRSDSADLAALAAGAGHYRVPITAYDFDAAADNTSIEFFINYKLSSLAGGQRIVALSNLTLGVNASLQFGATDAATPADDMRFFFRDNSAANKWDVTLPDIRTATTRAAYVQVTKVGSNWVGKVWTRAAGGSAAQIGGTQTVAVSGQVLFDIISVFAWERNTIGNYASGKAQDFFHKIGGAPNTEVNILDLLNTGTLV